MSVKVMNAVFERYPGGGGEMLLALALADHAHDDGTHVFPSVDTLALKSRQSARMVQYRLRDMELSGWLQPVGSAHGGRGRTREYRINPDWLRGEPLAQRPDAGKGAICDTERVQFPAEKGCKPERERVQSGALKGATAIAPAIEPQEPSVKRNTPHTPLGAPGLLRIQNELLGAAPKKRGNGGAITFAAFLADCREAGIKPIPPDDPVYLAAAQVGLPDEMLVLAWFTFKRRYAETKKRQSDWRMKFRNSVDGSWFGLWFVDADGTYRLTTRGKQAERLMEAAQHEVARDEG